MLVRGAEYAVSSGDLMLAERLSTAAARLDGSPEAKDVLAHTFSLSGRAEEADRLIANMDTRTWSDAERAARAFKRAGLRLFALSDPVGAKKLIDEASDPTLSGTAAKIIAAVPDSVGSERLLAPTGSLNANRRRPARLKARAALRARTVWVLAMSRSASARPLNENVCASTSLVGAAVCRAC